MLARVVSISWPPDPPALASQSAGITGVSQHAWPVPEMFWYGHAMRNNHIMENGVSIPYSLCHKQLNSTFSYLKMHNYYTIVALLCYHQAGLIQSSIFVPIRCWAFEYPSYDIGCLWSGICGTPHLAHDLFLLFSLPVQSSATQKPNW